MDLPSQAQGVHRCDLCETSLVHSYCDFCHINLCKPCIGEHISDGYDKHAIVIFQERGSTLKYPKCGTHQHRNCAFQCTDCDNILVCSSCMTSENHERHKFVDVTYAYKTKKEIIEKDKEKLERHIYPKYEEIEHDLENQLCSLDEIYEKLTTEIHKKGEDWHRKVDIVINILKNEISEIKVKHRHILKTHLFEIKQIQSFILQTLLAINDIEKSTEISLYIEYRSKIGEFSKYPPDVQVSLPTFIAKPIDHEKLYSLFGQITPLSTASATLEKERNISVLLDEPELITTIQTGHKHLRNVTCLNEKQIWISGMTTDIKCFDMTGSLQQIIQTKSHDFPFDMDVDSHGGLLYSDQSSKTVYKVRNGLTTELVKLQGWRPANLCVTSTADLLVTMYSVDFTQSKVVRYSGSTEKQAIQFDDEGKPLYSGNSNTKTITENRNHDICVADLVAGAVVVVNQYGKFRWRYTGCPSVNKNKPFEPYGITADSQSRILTADRDNHCIHILDQNGQVLHYIDKCDLQEPMGICVDNNDNLFVCDFSNGNVMKLKYSK